MQELGLCARRWRATDLLPVTTMTGGRLIPSFRRKPVSRKRGGGCVGMSWPGYAPAGLRSRRNDGFVRLTAGWTLWIPVAGIAAAITQKLADQENRSALIPNLYSREGSVRVESDREEHIGQGYVELTGYGEHRRPPVCEMQGIETEKQGGYSLESQSTAALPVERSVHPRWAFCKSPITSEA